MEFLTGNPITRYLFEHPDRVWEQAREHLLLCGISLGIALLISLPLGLLLSRVGRIATPVLVVLGIIYTIPSFALFAFLVPVTGIGQTPAIIALTAYSLVVLVRNTMVGFNGVDPAIIEAANGMGMSAAQRLWRIDLPLALPVIVAGIRIATLSTVALATVAAWIGAGGLGLLLKDGMNDPTYSKLYAGVLAVGAIAVGADLIFRLVERRVAVPTGQRRTAGRAAVPLAQPKGA